MREALTALVVAVPFVLGAATASAADGDEVVRFQDPAIVESSGLVARDGLLFTTNDSGDTGRVFAVDARTGRTVGVTTWSDDPVDVEALAPAPGGDVWVGDIGDNAATRDSIAVSRVPVGRGRRTVSPPAYHLDYPRYAADAETLLADPVSGRLYVATKGLFGGDLYAAPERLDAAAPNPLEKVGRILPMATDGAFFPDGRHVVLRDYGRAVVYRFPDLVRVADLSLPDQQQGEGIAVAPDGRRLFVSSEGVRAPVYEVPLPADVVAQVAAAPSKSPGPSTGPSTSPSTSPEPEASPSPSLASREGRELPETTETERPRWPWFLGGWVGVGVIVALVLALRRR